MKSTAKSLAVPLLMLLCATLGTLAWRQQSRLQALGKQLAASTDEQKKLQELAVETERRLAAAEKRNARLESEAKKAGGGPVSASGPGTGAVTRRIGPGGADTIRAIDNPEFQKAMAAGMRVSLDQRYAALFRKLKLDPAELEKLKDLLVDRQASAMDVMRAASSQGLNMMDNAADIRAMMEKVQADIDGNIRALLGDQRYAQYEDFNQHAASYAQLEQIERRLSYTSTPLQESQADPLLRILQNTAPPPSDDRRFGAFTTFGPGPAALAIGGQSPITDATIAQAGSVLSPPQLEALKQLQAEQQSQANMFQTAHISVSGGTGAAPAQPVTAGSGGP